MDLSNISREAMMAEQNGDFKAHQDTFDSVMSMIKWGTAATIVIVAIVVMLIAS
jgi:Bacterial aa3 type cytochrome c oxidase subunit IV